MPLFRICCHSWNNAGDRRISLTSGNVQWKPPVRLAGSVAACQLFEEAGGGVRCGNHAPPLPFAMVQVRHVVYHMLNVNAPTDLCYIETTPGIGGLGYMSGYTIVGDESGIGSGEEKMDSLGFSAASELEDEGSSAGFLALVQLHVPLIGEALISVVAAACCFRRAPRAITPRGRAIFASRRTPRRRLRFLLFPPCTTCH